MSPVQVPGLGHLGISLTSALWSEPVIGSSGLLVDTSSSSLILSPLEFLVLFGCIVICFHNAALKRGQQRGEGPVNLLAFYGFLFYYNNRMLLVF